MRPAPSMPVAAVQVMPPSVETTTKPFPEAMPEAMHLLPSLGSKARSRVFDLEVFELEVWFQLAPASVLRKIPCLVAARTIWLLFGLMARRLTNKKLVLAVEESCTQVEPPSVVLKMPAPWIASMLPKPSPVPA